ncbi:MAG: hypothetical protein FWD41_00690, partial [Actinomycetia bacterium]|nr:hypothetical protein [Actinomycetes bacterium]
TTFTPGSPIIWELKQIQPSVNGTTLVFAIAPDYDLGFRPMNGLSGPFIPSAYYDKWSGSEICAWLNSSQASNSVDYSLASGGVSGYGFLEQAFNAQQQEAIVPFGTIETNGSQVYDVSQKVVLGTMDEFPSWMGNRTIYPDDRSFAFRYPGTTGNYSQMKASIDDLAHGVPSSETQTDHDVAIRPVIRVSLDAPLFNSGTIYNWSVWDYPKSAVYTQNAAAQPLEVKTARAIGTQVTIPRFEWFREGPDGIVTGDVSRSAICPVRTDQLGEFKYWCVVTQGATVIETTQKVVISVVKFQEPELPCSDCHTSDVRAYHPDSGCSICHQSGDWANPSRMLDGFIKFNLSCGLDENECHGSGSIHPWHTTNVEEQHKIQNEIDVEDPLTGAAGVEDWSTAVVSNSCGGNLFDTSCHATLSTDTLLHFGNMDLMGTHNDYAKAAVQGKTKIATQLTGSGCSACHSGDRKTTINRVDNPQINCGTCHHGANYFSSDETATVQCLRPVMPAPGSGRSGASAPQKSPASIMPQKQSAPLQASPNVIELTSDLLGEKPDAEPLEAGVAEPSTIELPRGIFTIAPLLDGSSLALP